MKAEFLRHEYTWSKKSIGGTMGLGIVSSSIPKEKEQLRELEKMAAMAEVDSKTGMPVELLMYNSQTGFIKMTVKPVPAGADKRKNKKVYLYQCTDKNVTDPAVYCLPRGSWKPGNSTYLPRVSIDRPWDNSKEIFEKYHLSDRLPDLFRAVFWCVFRGSNNLAFVAPWEKEAFAANSRQIMYAIHSILPETLRKNAGYASYGCGMNQCCSFYFTDEKTEKNYYDMEVQEYVGEGSMEDEIDHFFYQTLATIYWQQPGLYAQFLEQMQLAISGRTIDQNVLREIQWLFLQFCIQNLMDIPPIQLTMELLPQLFYGAKDSIYLEEIQDNLMEYYHFSNWNREDYEKYLGVLENGITRKSEEKILEEMEWTMAQYGKNYKTMAREYLEHLHQNKPVLFSRLIARTYEIEGSLTQETFELSLRSLDDMRNYMVGLDQSVLPDDIKDIWMFRGIEILNEDVFDVEHFTIFSEIATIIDRKDSWIQSLSGFLKQMEEKKGELNESQLQAFHEVQKIYEKIALENGQTPEIISLPDEETEGMAAEIESEEESQPVSQEETPKRRQRKESVEEVEETISDFPENREKFLPFLLRSIPYGFLTGCVLFLINYAIVLGHWKISLGVGGMWIIMILNYIMDRSEKKTTGSYRLWMAIGLCIVEGYITQTTAWLFLAKNVRVYFFMGLGIATVLIQLIQIILVRKSNSESMEDV